MITSNLRNRQEVRKRYDAALSGGPIWLAGGIPAANCLIAYQPKLASSQSASYVNLANPGTYNLTPTTPPTWSASVGWTFTAASSQYGRTGLNTAANLSIFIVVNSVTGGHFCGGHDADGSSMVGFGYNGGNTSFYHGWPATNIAVSAASGSFGVSPGFAYRNGAQVGTIATAWAATGFEIYVGCRNSSGSPTNYLNGNVVFMAVYNIALAPYIAALHSATAGI